MSCKGVKVDISKPDQRKKAFEKSVSILGGLDIILNAAGIQRRYESPDFQLE